MFRGVSENDVWGAFVVASYHVCASVVTVRSVSTDPPRVLAVGLPVPRTYVTLSVATVVRGSPVAVVPSLSSGFAVDSSPGSVVGPEVTTDTVVPAICVVGNNDGSSVPALVGDSVSGVRFTPLVVAPFSPSVPVTSGDSVTAVSVLALCWPGSVVWLVDIVTVSVLSVVACTLVSLGSSDEVAASVDWVSRDTLTFTNGGVVGPDVVDDRVGVVTGLVTAGGC